LTTARGLVDVPDLVIQQIVIAQPTRELRTGYHGTLRKVAYDIVGTQQFLPSSAPSEWLGHGVYFFEDLELAWRWAESRHQKSAAVVRATVYLGFCLNLSDKDMVQALRQVNTLVRHEHLSQNKVLPVNLGSERSLNCAVLNRACMIAKPHVDSVLGRFSDEIIPGSGFPGDSHVQLCVRTLGNIHDPEIVEQGDQ
jgi:hypothetical protein